MHFNAPKIAVIAGSMFAAVDASPQYFRAHQSHGRPHGSGMGRPTGFRPSGSFDLVPTGLASINGSASFAVVAAAATSKPVSSAKSSKSTAAISVSSYSNATATGPSNGAAVAATTTFPTAAGESSLSEPMSVTGTFDGGMVRFDRGVSCTGQEEGGDSDAVFEVQEGGTLKNVIIGANQREGIHWMGACTIENVWWEAVCEDALTIKQTSGTSYVIGGGAKGAEDKVVQHNGGGTVNIDGFYVADFGKLYRSCGNCDTMYERHVIISNVVADSGSVLAGINSNYGDTATITSTCATDVKTICEEFEGNDIGDEPTEISSGPSNYCIYTDADATAC